MLELFEKQYSGYDQPILDLESVRFTLYLISFKGCIGPDRTIEKTWVDLKLAQISSRWWYFRRWAAKKQIECPMRVFAFHIERTVNDDDKRTAEIKRLKDKQKAAKAKVTQITAKIETAKSNWDRLFPIEEDEQYQKAMAYLFKKRSEIAELEDQISKLLKDTTP